MKNPLTLSARLERPLLNLASRRTSFAIGKASFRAGAAKLGTAASPARELQKKVAKAFNTEIPSETAPERQERLEGALVGLTDLKARLDAMRVRRAA